jgi:hypothetical protein
MHKNITKINSLGNAMMDPLSPWDAVKAFTPVIQGAKAKGSLVIGQVTHAGRVRDSRLVRLHCWLISS